MTLRRAAIVAPIRTAVGKFGGSLSSLTAGQLGATILKALIERVDHIELTGQPIGGINNIIRGYAQLPIRLTAA